MLTLISISLRNANAFVSEHHRHHKPVTGHKFSVGCVRDGRLVGVAIVGRPVSRYLDDGRTVEVSTVVINQVKQILLASFIANSSKPQTSGILAI